MRLSRILLALAAGMLMSAAAHAQPKATTKPKPKPKAESVLSHIPAGALGFIIVNDMRALARKADGLLDEVGVGEMLKKVAPDGTLGMLATQLKLGYGFNPDGGFAIVMLDPKAHGVSLLRMMDLPDPAFKEPKEPKTQPREQKPPFVVFVPGEGPKEVFGAYKIEDAGKYKRIKFPGLSLLATKLGGYVLLSPMAGALDAVLGAKKKIAPTLTRDQLAVLTKSQAAAHVNMKIAYPTIDGVLKSAEQQLGDSSMGMMFMFAMPVAPAGLWTLPQLSFYRYAFSQMDGMTVALRMEKTGLAFDILAAWKPDSLFAKAYADQKPVPVPLMASVPDRGHVFAIAAAPERGPHGVALERKRVEAIVTSPMTQSMSEKWRAQFKQFGHKLADRVEQWELVFGGGGEKEDSGVFSVALVMRGKDADKIKPLVADMGKLFAGWFLEKVADGDANEAVKVEYVKAVETIEKLPVDAMEFTHDELEEESDKIETMLGEDKLRFLVATPDKKTVVVTMGGSKAFMAEAIKAARAKAATITCAKPAAESMKFMPKNATTLAVFNIGNLFEVIMNGSARMGETSEAPFSLSCKTPISYGSAIVGRHKHGVLYVPTSVIKDVVDAYLSVTRAFSTPMPMPEDPKPLDGEDF